MLTYRLLRRHQNNIIVCIYLCGQFLKNRKVANSDENYRCAATTIRALGAFKPSPIRENALTCYTDIKNPETVMQYYLRTVSGLHFTDLSACDGWSSRRYVEVTN